MPKPDTTERSSGNASVEVGRARLMTVRVPSMATALNCSSVGCPAVTSRLSRRRKLRIEPTVESSRSGGSLIGRNVQGDRLRQGLPGRVPVALIDPDEIPIFVVPTGPVKAFLPLSRIGGGLDGGPFQPSV